MKNKKTIAVILLLLFASAAVLFAFFGPKSSPSPAKGQPDLYADSSLPKENAAGMPLIPNFALEDLNGNRVELADFAGKRIVINFWATWCKYCVTEMDDFEKLSAAYAGSADMVILMVNATDGEQETREKAVAFLKEKGYKSMQVYFDNGLYASAIFGVNSLPCTFVIGKDGYLEDYRIGYCTYDEMAALAAPAK